MSVRKETYIIYGIKLDEDFTKKFWSESFYDDMVWEKTKPKNKPYFITDGMNGNYTFFGIITQLTNGSYDEEDYKEIEIDKKSKPFYIENCFRAFYPDMKIEKVKLYYLPHYV